MRDNRMRMRSARIGVVAGLVVAIAAGASMGQAADPYQVKLKDGSTFKLAQRIQDKITKGEKVNYVFSYASSGIKGFSEQYKAGYEATQGTAGRILPMSFKSIAPSAPTGDLQLQIQQIQALANTNQIDCLSIEPANSDGMTSITNQLMAKGIPVFTVGLTSNGNELTNFTQQPNKEGHTAAATVAELHEGAQPALQDVRGLGRRPLAVLGRRSAPRASARASRRPSRAPSS